MNGNERRRMELIHPEYFSTSEETRREIAKTLVGICKGICLTTMIIGAVIVAYLSTRYTGYTGLFIAFFGTILDVIFGMFIAYNFGNKIQKIYTESYLNFKVVS
jgi:hypothetical protein